MRTLYPLGDIDLLDAYHLCGGRVVTYCTPNACRSDPCFDRVSVESYGDSYGGDCGLGLGFRGERGLSIDCEDVRDNDSDGTLHDASYGVAATRLPKEKREEEVGLRGSTCIAAKTTTAVKRGATCLSYRDGIVYDQYSVRC